MPELRRGDRDLASLAVLAFLSTGPRHPYDIHRFLVDTGKRFVTGLPRSLYHAVTKLERAGLIESVGTTRQARRPERTVYALTDDGHQEARRRVELLLSTPAADADVTYAALSFAAVLSRQHASAALRRRADALAEATSQVRDGLRSARASEVPRLLLIESEYEIARMRAERTWVISLASEIESGELQWLQASPSGESDTPTG